MSVLQQVLPKIIHYMPTPMQVKGYRNPALKVRLCLFATMLVIAGCGSESAESVSSNNPEVTKQPAKESLSKRSNAPSDCASNADFTLRVVYNVSNTFEQEALRAQGAPAQVKGITKRELIMRDKARLIRRTGKTYMDDPDEIIRLDKWQDEIADIQSSAAFLAESAKLNVARSKVPKVVLRIDWTEFRAPPGQYSYRYGLDPMVPLAGEKWREDDSDPWDSDEAKEALSEPGMITVDANFMDGVTVSKTTYAGHECEMLRRDTGTSVHETCYAIFDNRSVMLHGMDQSAKGSMTQTAESIELGLCVTDDMLAAPGRVKLEEDDWG